MDFIEIVTSPIGDLSLAFDNTGLVKISLACDDEKCTDKIPSIFAVELKEYFDGRRQHFDFCAQIQVSDFARSVMQALSLVPYGATISYGQLAVRAGYPVGAARAVGAVMRNNPLPILYPCHRVVCANGAIGGYSLGGPDTKRWLIALEADMVRQCQ